MTDFWNNNIQVTTAPLAANNFHRVNKRFPSLWLQSFCSLAGWCLVSSPLSAQIAPDGTLGTEVNVIDNDTEITGGTEAESNLVHSFQDFSLGTGDTAFFNNGLDIKNIIGRVTGNNISDINGLIRANGNANLILINENGISFGENASLDIGGSFLASTAESVIFEDGTVLNADPTVEPLITVSAPVGLQFGENSAEIEVLGPGHVLSVDEPLFSPIVFGEQSGIRVQPDQTLALLGKGITINGGVVAAPGGKIELGSVAEGTVALDLSDSQMSLSYENVTILDNIELRSQGLADASGTESIPGGSIQVQGRQLSLNDGSLLLVQNQSNGPAGVISVNTSESVTVSGTNNNGTIRSSIINETIAGEGGDLKITTNQLTVDQGAAITAKTLQPANAAGGDVEIKAAESIQVIGSSSINPSVTSFIAAASFGAGNGGNSTISTDFLSAIAGGTVVATTLGMGNGGDLNISANTIEVVGVEPNIFAASALTASTLSQGNAGDLTISTSTLEILAGGRIDSSTVAGGDAGNLKITAADSIIADGTVPGSLDPSLISSAAGIVDPSLQEILQLPAVPTGNSGSVTINTPRLNITNGALITTSNDGSGNSGSVSINADSIWLNNNSSITSKAGGMPRIFPGDEDSFSQPQNIPDNISFGLPQNLEPIQGENITISTRELIVEQGANIFTGTANTIAGGNIIINASESVLVKGFSEINPNNLSFISTSSFGPANSGNINLSTKRLTVLDGARVAAGTFVTGLGGDVNIQAESIEVVGVEPSQSVASLVGASSLGVGNAGSLNLDTAKLTIRDGGRVDSSAAAIGSAGDVNIQVTESIEISGQTSGTNEPSRISSGANVEDEIARQLFQLPDTPSGDAGSVIVVTEDLQIRDQGEISVINSGLGDGGTLEINADTISLDRRGIITAATQSGEGGNIVLDTENLIWQGESLTTATAAGNGNGGNITIDADTIVALEGSQVTADAFLGRGGNIEIDAEGLIICQTCKVSASSQLGIDGVIDIETLEPTTLDSLGLLQQPTQPQEEVAVACSFDRGATVSKLTVTGRGGLPNRPQEMLNSKSLIEFNQVDDNRLPDPLGNLSPEGESTVDTFNNSVVQKKPSVLKDTQTTSRYGLTVRGPELSSGKVPSTSIKHPLSIGHKALPLGSSFSMTKNTLPSPARSWYKNPQGSVVLTSQADSVSPNNIVSISIDCHVP